MAGTAPTLADVLKDIKKISGKDALMEGIKQIDIPRVKCPANQLNLTFTGGGCPRGRIIELFGAEGAGKSTASLMIAAGFQQADERPIFYVDTSPNNFSAAANEPVKQSPAPTVSTGFILLYVSKCSMRSFE